MCSLPQESTRTRGVRPGTTSKYQNAEKSAGIRQRLPALWPLHPLLAAAAFVLFLPSSYYLNAGFTVWFHNITVFYLLTDIEFLRRFLIVMGTSINLGWYAAVCSDLYRHGRFCHILYMNMPAPMKSAMVGGDGHVLYTPASLSMKIASHVLDTALHPGVVYALWRAHGRSRPSSRRTGAGVRDVITWPTVACAYAMSRLWSVVQTGYNGGGVGMFYFGYDVYHIHDLDSWLPAYLAEGLFFSVLVTVLVLRRRGAEAKNKFE